MPEIIKPLAEVEVLKGQPVVLECHVSGAADAQVRWYHDNDLISDDERISSSFDGTVCILTIQDSTLEDEGDYLCQIENDQGVVSTSAEVLVEEGMALPIFKEKLHNLKVVEGENACFDIRVVGNPEPVVEWFKDSVQLEDEGRVMIIDDVDDNEPDLFSLVIENCKPSDAGQYTCLAMNEAGKDSCTADLSVIPKSESLKTPDTAEIPLEFLEGQDVTLKALMSADHPTVSWLKDDEPITQSDHYNIDAKEGVHTLTIKDASPEDSGIYTCETTDDSTSTFSVTIKGNIYTFPHIYNYFVFCILRTLLLLSKMCFNNVSPARQIMCDRLCHKRNRKQLNNF